MGMLMPPKRPTPVHECPPHVIVPTPECARTAPEGQSIQAMTTGWKWPVIEAVCAAVRPRDTFTMGSAP